MILKGWHLVKGDYLRKTDQVLYPLQSEAQLAQEV